MSPPSYARAHQLALGDVLATYCPKTDHLDFAIYGDCCSFGEGSVRLHQDLGSNRVATDNQGVSRAKAGIADRVILWCCQVLTLTQRWRRNAGERRSSPAEKTPLGGGETCRRQSLRGSPIRAGSRHDRTSARLGAGLVVRGHLRQQLPLARLQEADVRLPATNVQFVVRLRGGSRPD